VTSNEDSSLFELLQRIDDCLGAARAALSHPPPYVLRAIAQIESAQRLIRIAEQKSVTDAPGANQ